MLRPLFVCLSATLLATAVAAAAETVVEHDFLTIGEPSGSQTVTYADDGSLSVEFHFNDRGRGPQTRSIVRLDANGLPVLLHTTGVNYYKAQVDEQFSQVEGTARWRSTVEQGEQKVAGPAVYVPSNSFPEYTAILARALLAQPERRLALLPAGEANIREVESITLDDVERSQITLYAITGLGSMPEYLWLNQAGELYGADYNWFGVTPKGQGASIAQLKERQQAAQDRYLTDVAQRLREPLEGLVAIVNARLFDAQNARVLPQASVFLQDGVISAVYEQSVMAPEEATVIDADGMLLMPALWDMHGHIGASDYLNYLAAGVTNVRDMANDPDYVLRTRREAAHGRIAAPDIYPMGFIDRRGEFAAPTGMLAATLEEAIEFVDYYARRGFHGIKLYSSIDPAWVAPIAERAHSLDLTVLGHIPSGMTAADAIRAGFDEVTHVNMILLNFLNGAQIDTRTPQRFIVPTREAGELDPWSAEVSDFIQLMRTHGVAHDPTYSLFMQMFTNTPGEVSSLATPFIDHLPPTLARSMVSEPGFNEGIEVEGRATAQMTRALIRRLHDAGIRLLPGTDWGPAGFAVIRDMMYLAEAGIPPADVLRAATLGAAEHMGVDQQLGSVSKGKRAHLVLVPGDPLSDLSALYGARYVIKDQAIYRPADLLREAGFLPFGDAR
ncbi:MAG: amidohydrolase family protein [Pseudomonadota bacterium]